MPALNQPIIKTTAATSVHIDQVGDGRAERCPAVNAGAPLHECRGSPLPSPQLLGLIPA